jgi:hypothetical protein
MASFRRSPWLWAIAGAMFLVLALWPAWYVGAWWRLHQTQAEILAAGWPTTEAEVIPQEIPADRNAAPLLVDMQKIWQGLKDSEGFIKPSPGADEAERNPLMFDAARLGQLQAQMQKQEVREMFRLLHESSRKSAAWFERDYSNAMLIGLEPVASMLPAVQLLCARAWLAARQGDQKDAANDLLTCSRLSLFGLHDILLIGWLVGVAVDNLLVNSAQLVISELPPGSFIMNEWKALGDSWSKHAGEARAQLCEVLDAERVIYGGYVFEGAMQGRVSLGDLVVDTLFIDDPSPRATEWRKTMSAYQTIWKPLVLSDYVAYLQMMQAVRSEVKNGSQGQDVAESKKFSTSVPKWALLTRLSAPVFDGIPERLAEYEVNLQLGRLGLDLEDFRSREGKYPASLLELGLPDERITDPFTGRPFIYRAENDNVLVYSVGFDREDDGGLHAPRKERHDIVWRVDRMNGDPSGT